MIVVTGTPRSGTSMWMQILVAAGFPAIGEAFPGDWGALLAEANPDGFWESQLLGGIYYRTNPHPLTGAFLFPEQTELHAVKVMVQGLVRSDLAFLDRAIATVREWRQFVASRERLGSMHDDLLGLEPVDRALRQNLPPALEWWVDNFALIRDIATRRYSAHVCSYQSLLDDPERAVDEVLRWLGKGDRGKAIAAVRPHRKTQGEQSPSPPDLEPEHAEVFDEFYDHIHRARPLSLAFLQRLDETDRALRPRVLAHEIEARLAAARDLLG
ncbi:hypothetical protein ACNOYE_19870 [Nannocystaceae bacterium ST9]